MYLYFIFGNTINIKYKEVHNMNRITIDRILEYITIFFIAIIILHGVTIKINDTVYKWQGLISIITSFLK